MVQHHSTTFYGQEIVLRLNIKSGCKFYSHYHLPEITILTQITIETISAEITLRLLINKL